MNQHRLYRTHLTHLNTCPWHSSTELSSLAEANNGSWGWKHTDRTASLWCLCKENSLWVTGHKAQIWIHQWKSLPKSHRAIKTKVIGFQSFIYQNGPFLGKKSKAIAFGFVKNWPVTKLKSKHIIGKAFSRATEFILLFWNWTIQTKDFLKFLKFAVKHISAILTYTAPECLIRFWREVHIKPDYSFIIRGEEKVVSWRVHCYGRYPFDSREQFLHQLLSSKIVHSYICLSLMWGQKKKNSYSID